MLMTRPDELLNDLARGCRILEMEGHGDFSLGHLSLRDPQGRGFWLKRNRYGLGEILGPDDFVLVTMDGEQIAGEGGRHSEWPIHSEVFRLRPDVQVVGKPLTLAVGPVDNHLDGGVGRPALAGLPQHDVQDFRGPETRGQGDAAAALGRDAHVIPTVDAFRQVKEILVHWSKHLAGY